MHCIRCTAKITTDHSRHYRTSQAVRPKVIIRQTLPPVFVLSGLPCLAMLGYSSTIDLPSSEKLALIILPDRDARVRIILG